MEHITQKDKNLLKTLIPKSLKEIISEFEPPLSKDSYILRRAAYRAVKNLMLHKKRIEPALWQKEAYLFSLNEIIKLYDTDLENNVK